VGGDFNGAAYRSSKDSQLDVNDEQDVHNSASPMAADEFQFVLDIANKDVPISKRIGLQFRNVNPLDATHYRPSIGEIEGIHCAKPKGYLDTMLCFHVSLPLFNQQDAYRRAYEQITVKSHRNDGLTCKDDGSDLPTIFFPTPVNVMRSDLNLSVGIREHLRMDHDASNHESVHTTQPKGKTKRAAQTYGDAHPQLIISMTLRQPPGGPKVVQNQRSRSGAAWDKQKRPASVVQLAHDRQSLSSNATRRTQQPTTTDAPWARLVVPQNRGNSDKTLSSSGSASVAERPIAAPPLPPPPNRPVPRAADAMVNQVAPPKRPPPPAPAFDSDVESVNESTGSDQGKISINLGQESDVPMKAPPVPFEKRPKSYYQQPLPPPVKVPPTTPPKVVETPTETAMPVPGILAHLADQRNLEKRNRRAKAPMANIAKAVLTGITTKAASELGVDAQEADSLVPTPTSVGLHQIAFTFLLGILVGMFFLKCFQTNSGLTALYRLCGYVRYFWRLIYYFCRTLALCTCNCTCWFRRYQTSVDRIYDRIANKGKGKGKTSFWQRRRMTFSQSLASARAFAQANVSFSAFTAERPQPVSRENSSSSLSGSSSGYETPPVGWVGVLYVLRHYQVQMAHFSLDVLRLLRNLLVPLPATMNANRNMANPDHDEPMPQRGTVPQQDLASISRTHAPGRWAYSQETLAALRENSPKGSGKSGKSSSSSAFADMWTDNSSANSDVVSVTYLNMVPPAGPTVTLGHGPFWINHISSIHLSGEDAEPDYSGYFASVTHDIGWCERTGYFCTGTCLNDIEKAMLLRHCVLVPNGALGGHFNHPQFRVVALPPWAHSAFTHFWQYATPFLRDMCLSNPMFSRGGDIVRLNALYVAHMAALNEYREEAKESYSEQNPVESDAWERLFVQSASRESKMDPYNRTVRTPVRLPQANLAVELHMVSNNVNARILDRAGSVYFVFYNGGYHGETNSEFPPGLNCANHDNTREIMQIVARQVPMTAGLSLLFDWLHGTHGAQEVQRQDDFTPGLASRSVSPRLSDAHMDIDS